MAWFGDQALDQIHIECLEGLAEAAIVVRRRAVQLISIPGTGREGTTAGHSKPGEPPRKQTGNLRNHTDYEVDSQSSEARIGTNVPYGRYLELGTKRGILPRPWLRRALVESQAEINNLLKRGK
jgi:hypothetical protein